MRNLTESEASNYIKQILDRLDCIIISYPDFDSFPPKGKAKTIYIDESTDPNEMWRWDCGIKDYVQIGGGGSGGATDGLHFSQLSYSMFYDGASLTQSINSTPQNFVFTTVANIGTDVVGSTSTNVITVSEAAWYQIDVSSLLMTNSEGTITIQIYINGDSIVELPLQSDSIVSGHVIHSWKKKINLDPGDEVSVKIFRPLVEGATTVDKFYADFSVQKITLGYVEATTGINIPQSANYASLPAPGTEVGLYRWVINTVGSDNAGLYYSDGLTWETAPGGTQVNADWDAVSGPEEILNKPSIPVITQVNSVTIPAASFSLVSGLYEAEYSNVNILTTSVVSITPKNTTVSIVTAAVFLPEITVSLGSIKMYCTNLPSADFDVNILIIN